jgi:hypothetical protein
MSGEMSLHPELQGRLTSLSARIAKLRQQMIHMTKPAQIEDAGELFELERRYSLLKDQLDRLDSEGAGFRQDVKAEIETMTSDVEATIEDSMIRLDRAGCDRIMGGPDQRES